MAARVLETLLGMWLLVAAFLWPRGTAAFHLNWVCALLVVLCSLLSAAGMLWPRYVNWLLALTLVVSTLFFDGSGALKINQLLAGVVLFVLSDLPNAPQRRPRWFSTG